MSGRPSRSTRSSTGTTRRLSPSSDTAAPAAAPPSSCALYRAIASSSPSFCSMISPTDFFSGATYRSFCEPPKDEERRGERGGAAVGAASVIAIDETLTSSLELDDEVPRAAASARCFSSRRSPSCPAPARTTARGPARRRAARPASCVRRSRQTSSVPAHICRVWETPAERHEHRLVHAADVFAARRGLPGERRHVGCIRASATTFAARASRRCAEHDCVALGANGWATSSKWPVPAGRHLAAGWARSHPGAHIASEAKRFCCADA